MHIVFYVLHVLQSRPSPMVHVVLRDFDSTLVSGQRCAHIPKHVVQDKQRTKTLQEFRARSRSVWADGALGEYLASIVPREELMKHVVKVLEKHGIPNVTHVVLKGSVALGVLAQMQEKGKVRTCASLLKKRLIDRMRTRDLDLTLYPKKGVDMARLRETMTTAVLPDLRKKLSELYSNFWESLQKAHPAMCEDAVCHFREADGKQIVFAKTHNQVHADVARERADLILLQGMSDSSDMLIAMECKNDNRTPGEVRVVLGNQKHTHPVYASVNMSIDDPSIGADLNTKFDLFRVKYRSLAWVKMDQSYRQYSASGELVDVSISYTDSVQEEHLLPVSGVPHLFVMDLEAAIREIEKQFETQGPALPKAASKAERLFLLYVMATGDEHDALRRLQQFEWKLGAARRNHRAIKDLLAEAPECE